MVDFPAKKSRVSADPAKKGPQFAFNWLLKFHQIPIFNWVVLSPIYSGDTAHWRYQTDPVTPNLWLVNLIPVHVHPGIRPYNTLY